VVYWFKFICSSGVLSLCPCFLPASLFLLPKRRLFFTSAISVVCVFVRYQNETNTPELLTNETKREKENNTRKNRKE